MIDSSSKWFYLVIKGYEAERITICAPTTNLEEIRRLGQQIGLNLNINYFDEANISKFHVIRHFK